MVFFLTMYFYIKMGSKLLKKRERWLKIFTVLWNVSLSLFILIELYVIVAVAFSRVNDDTLCSHSAYLIMQASNMVIIAAFLTLGFFVDKRVKQQRQAENQYEVAFRQKTQQKALSNLKMIIAVFSAVQLYCFAYAIAMFSTKASCQYPSQSVGLGFFIWTLTHALQYLVWVYPVMYILWPRAL